MSPGSAQNLKEDEPKEANNKIHYNLKVRS